MRPPAASQGNAASCREGPEQRVPRRSRFQLSIVPEAPQSVAVWGQGSSVRLRGHAALDSDSRPQRRGHGRRCCRWSPRCRALPGVELRDHRLRRRKQRWDMGRARSIARDLPRAAAHPEPFAFRHPVHDEAPLRGRGRRLDLFRAGRRPGARRGPTADVGASRGCGAGGGSQGPEERSRDADRLGSDLFGAARVDLSASGPRHRQRQAVPLRGAASRASTQSVEFLRGGDPHRALRARTNRTGGRHPAPSPHRGIREGRNAGRRATRIS